MLIFTFYFILLNFEFDFGTGRVSNSTEILAFWWCRLHLEKRNHFENKPLTGHKIKYELLGNKGDLNPMKIDWNCRWAIPSKIFCMYYISSELMKSWWETKKLWRSDENFPVLRQWNSRDSDATFWIGHTPEPYA